MTLQVSVIVPVYNSVDYVRDAIESVRDQTIDPEVVEILAVDDGSTDGSDVVLAELAEEIPRMTVITQENSGTPGGGRNPAIGRARGEFVFFLDSDDRLTPDALRRMVETARSEGADVVLGRMTSTDKRHAPASMFTRTVLDADLVEDNVFHTLGPTKLIRRELIDRLDLRFPEDQKIGEDQPFMATVYLNARRISILSDMDYYVIRHREDGSNLTLTRRTSETQMMMAVRLARTIEQYTEPGERRDALLKRPFGWTMTRALDSRWTTIDREEQGRLAESFRSEVAHLYTDGVRARIKEDVRVLLDLLLAGELDGLQAYCEHLASKPERSIERRDGRFVRRLPAHLEPLVPEQDRVVTAPKVTCRLEDVRVRGRQITVSATVKIADLDSGPEALGLRARRRDTEDVEELRTTSVDLAPRTRSSALTAVHDGLDRGVWDLFVVVGVGDWEKEVRLGASRARAIPPEGDSNLADDPEPQDRVLAYFTQGPGNLSIDSGAVLHRNLGRARAVGLTVDENERALLLVRTSSAPVAGDEFFAHLDDPRQHGGRQLLPVLRLGERLLGLRLPVTAQDVGVTLSVTAVLGGVSAPLPATGTEFWPARATGFGLKLTEEGGLQVTAPAESGRDRHVLPRLEAAVAGARRRSVRERVVPVVKGLPVVGPALTSAVRAVRERRS
ncbi:glycosyltransferase family 2 protein [Brachybacterium sp. AOP43-C2-M15]|uniref:glycosyltransferase family 2 protein n=1 Tax=Brachybacterium sp. AOP43-C2-M15 TaxID=3457661 RepID=UPI004033E197